MNSVNAGIRYASVYGEFDACIAAGMDISKWRANEYDAELKAEVVAWHQLRGSISMHQNDAVQRKQAQMSKKR